LPGGRGGRDRGHDPPAYADRGRAGPPRRLRRSHARAVPPAPGGVRVTAMTAAVALSTVLLLLLVCGTAISLPLPAIYDAMSFSPARWQQVGHSRRTWVTLMAVGIIPVGLLGIAVAIEYLRTVRPK